MCLEIAEKRYLGGLYFPALRVRNGVLPKYHYTGRFRSESVIAGLGQYLANLVREGGGRERFLQKRNAGIQDSMMDDGVCGVTGGEQHLHSRSLRLERFRKLFATHARHDHIGDE